MAHTNSTPNYNLPQFLGTDKPAWLTDVNNAMSDIDVAIAAAKTTADTADAAVGALGVTVGNHTTQLSTLSGAVTSQGNTLNTVTSLIGNGVPTTTDQTIIGAINELHANQGDLADLTTTDKDSFVDAINEVAANVVVVDQTPGATYTADFSVAATQQGANAGFRVPINLPFTCNNSNYTVSMTVNSISNVSGTPETKTTTEKKEKNSFIGALFHANEVSDALAVGIASGTYTITFA